MDTITIRIDPVTVARVDRLRDRYAADPNTAVIAREMKRSALLRAAIERGLDGLEGPAGLPTYARSAGR